ncbi:death-associated protein 1 [Pitangus sulphuratus]|nr:death-associated protein 1 [Pitangus sulphuratus]
MAKSSMVTKTELPQSHTSLHVSGCKEFLSLELVSEGSRDKSCMWCDQVYDLLSLVAEFYEEVERLRSIRDYEREIDQWSHTLPSLKETQQLEAQKESEEP